MASSQMEGSARAPCGACFSLPAAAPTLERMGRHARPLRKRIQADFTQESCRRAACKLKHAPHHSPFPLFWRRGGRARLAARYALGSRAAEDRHRRSLTFSLNRNPLSVWRGPRVRQVAHPRSVPASTLRPSFASPLKLSFPRSLDLRLTCAILWLSIWGCTGFDGAGCLWTAGGRASATIK